MPEIKTSTYALMVKTLESHSKILEEHTECIRAMEKKVFNGFGDRIKSLEIKVDKDIDDNQKGHDKIMKTLEHVIKFGATAMVMLIISLIGIFGSIWVQDRTRSREHMETQELISEPNYSSFEGSVPTAE